MVEVLALNPFGPLHIKEYGPTPPTIVAVILPFDPPLHPIAYWPDSEALRAMLRGAGATRS